MDQLLTVGKPARGQLDRKVKSPCRCIITYVLQCAFVYVPGQVYFLLGYKCIRARFTTVYAYICVTTAVSVHIMYFECSSTYICILCTMTSATLLYAPSLRPISACAKSKSAKERHVNIMDPALSQEFHLFLRTGKSFKNIKLLDKNSYFYKYTAALKKNLNASCCIGIPRVCSAKEMYKCVFLFF